MFTWKRLAILAFVVSMTACNYRVTDPGSGRVYYTNNIKHYKQSGTIRFKDKLTRQNVTLSSSEYEELSAKEFKLQLEEARKAKSR